jgi:hypothetical protein
MGYDIIIEPNLNYKKKLRFYLKIIEKEREKT